MGNVPTWQVRTDALKGLPRGRGPGMGVSGRYVLRQIRRAPLKSALAMALALGFVVALGWMGPDRRAQPGGGGPAL